MNTAFHDLLNLATSIRNVLSLIISEKDQSQKQTQEYLKGCLERSNQLIQGLENLREKWLAGMEQ